jgi:pimeloyl-ACP methyl ester carboxylesterase
MSKTKRVKGKGLREARRARKMQKIPTSLRRLSFVAVALTALGTMPVAQARAKAVAVIAEGLGLSFPRPFAAEVTREEVELGGVAGDLYGGSEPWPAIVLVAGAAPDGKDDARIVRLARALARAGRTVFVPQLALADKRFETADIDALVVSVLELAKRHPARIVMFGFSYGGSFALLAAADDRLDVSLGQVATFGAYFDLVGVAQAVTSGTSLVDGRRVPWDAHPRAADVFRDVVLELAGPGAREGLEAALDGAEAAELDGATRAVYDFLTNEDPEQTYALAARLPQPMIDTLRTFSPATIAGEIEAEVVALHSTDDPLVPFGEALRLVAAMPDASLETVSLFSHVNLTDGSPMRRASDLLATWRFASRILSAQE